MRNRNRLKGYLAFHSFGNKILYPWGHTSKHTRDWKDLREFASVAANAIQRNSQAQRRAFPGLLFNDPTVKNYTVRQQSFRDASEIQEKQIRRTLNPELDEQVSQTKEVE